MSSTKPCPYCGFEKLKFEYKSGGFLSRKERDMGYFNSYTGCIRCNKCHSRGPTVNYKSKSMHYLKEHELAEFEQLTIDIWNIRV